MLPLFSILMITIGDNMSKVINILDKDFDEEVVESRTPVLVEFWAEWCGPCKMLSPLLDEVAKENTGKLKVVKVNIDDNQLTPPMYGIRGIPSILIFKEGQVVGQQIGALTRPQLSNLISEII